MPKILNQELYDRVKRIADAVYSKPSAYKSGFIVKKYKELGGKYADDNEPKKLKRWFKEDWQDVAGLDYPVYRPTKKISKDTPLTPEEIDPKNLMEQSILKQQYKGNKNLPQFIGKGMPYEITQYSKKRAEDLGVKIAPSTRKGKKIDVYDYHNNYITSIGAIGYGDYPTFWKLNGKEFADKKRALYKKRHAKDRVVLGSAGYYADKILW